MCSRLPQQALPPDLAVTSSPAFRRWFGESKLVDDAGSPLVLYRGEQSGNYFSAFDRRRSRDFGFFLTPDPAVASDYDRNGTPRAFYVSAPRLLDLTVESREATEFVARWAANWEDWIDTRSGEPAEPWAWVASGYLFDYEGNWSSERWRDLQASIADDYDAAPLPDIHSHEDRSLGRYLITSCIVFNACNIKSAVGNTSFNPETPNVYQ